MKKDIKLFIVKRLDLIVIIFFSLLFIIFVLADYLDTKAEHNQCEIHNMEYYSHGSVKYCIEEDGTTHFVRIKCKGFIKVNCEIQFLKIGEIRIER